MDNGIPLGCRCFCLDVQSEFLIVLLRRCYAAEMAPIGRKITRWIFDNLLWDTAGTAREGFWAGLWATRKLLIALAGSFLLTWWEWVEHHPPAITIVAFIHFVFVFAGIALLVYAGQWFSRSKRSLNK